MLITILIPPSFYLSSLSSLSYIRQESSTLRTMHKLRFFLGIFPFLSLILFFFFSYIHLYPTKISVQNPMITSPKEFSILIGILTRADLYNHRHFLRMLYSIQSSSVADIDVKFVFCNLTKEEQRVLVSLEIIRYNDIIVLNCTENMNNGKTYTYLSSLPKLLSRRYDFVMKADDDVYIRLEQLSVSIRQLKLRQDFYYGFVIPCKSKDPFIEYMSGMAYLVSWDVVEWISESEIPARNMVGPEDRLVGEWLKMGGKGRNRFTEKPAMYDYPGTNGACSHELVKETVAVHRLKRWQQWLDVIRFFNLTEGLESLFLHHV